MSFRLHPVVLSRKTAVIRTLLFVATLPVVFWLATSAVLPNAHYSNAETFATPNPPIEWRHTVDGWEPIDELHVEAPPTNQQPPIHPLTLLPLVVAIALAALLAFEPQADQPTVEMAQSSASETDAAAISETANSAPA